MNKMNFMKIFSEGFLNSLMLNSSSAAELLQNYFFKKIQQAIVGYYLPLHVYDSLVST